MPSLPDPLWARARAEAARRGEVSIGEVIRRFLTQYAPEGER